MRELYRRFGALLLLFLAVTFFLAVRDDVIRLYAVDMAEEYRSAYLPVEGWGASIAMRGVVRSSKRISSVAAFIDAHTEGRLEVVEGKSWEEIFAGVLAPPETSPLPDRRASDTWRASYYFLPKEDPFPEVFREMKSEDQAFRFLKLSAPSGPRFIGMTVQGPEDAMSAGAPSWILYPFRRFAAVPLLLALFVYLLFPPRKKAPAGALVYPKWSSWILPDLMGLLFSCIFFAFPFFLAPAIFGSGNVLNIADGGIILTLVFWLMAAIFASILYWSAKYASFSLELLPGAMMLRTLGKEQRIPYIAIESAGIADYRPPKWLRTTLFIASLGSWRMLGHALLLSSRSDWGIELRMKHGDPVKFLCSNLPGAERIVEALRREGVNISPELESVFSERDDR